jgi:muramidase (phage lysozyme)
MKSPALIAAAGLLAYGGWLMYRNSQTTDTTTSGGDWSGGALLTDAEEVLSNAGETAATFVDNITGGTMRVSSMSRVNPADLNNRNVQAVLRMIRVAEGTAGENGYRTLFGGGLFDSYADHPRQRITRRMGGTQITSTAAGAYQFLASTWDETARAMKLTSFSPGNQELGALGRLAFRGALEDIKAGRFEAGVKKIAREWASLPGSPYGQPVISWERARALYAAWGGNDTTTA